MEARLVDELGRDQARTAHELHAHGDPSYHCISRQTVTFHDRENCGDDHRARVHRPAFERVVEVLAVRGSAVDERGAGGIQRARVADGGAAAVRLPALERRAHVVGVARSDAQAGDVDQQLLDQLAHCVRDSHLRGSGEGF